MGISYEEVVNNGLLSDELLRCIPSECDCGAPIEFTESLRQIQCSDTSCVYKIAARLESMAKEMKADGWGESTCIAACKEFGIISPYQVFLLEDKVNNGYTSNSISAFDKKVLNICDKGKRKIKLWEVVKMAGIPGIGSIAYKIFDGYDSLTDAFNDIEKWEVAFISEKLDIKNTDGGVLAINVYNKLIEYKQELLFGETQFDIFKPTGVTLYIAATGGVYGFRNKSEFVDYVNNRYSGKVNAMLLGSVTQQVDILIADGDTSSRKFKSASRINENYAEKGIGEGKFTREQVGIYGNDKDICPIGQKILITNSEGAIEVLDRVFG